MPALVSRRNSAQNGGEFTVVIQSSGITYTNNTGAEFALTIKYCYNRSGKSPNYTYTDWGISGAQVSKGSGSLPNTVSTSTNDRTYVAIRPIPSSVNGNTPSTLLLNNLQWALLIDYTNSYELNSNYETFTSKIIW